jgi:hypothetical protein
LTAKLVVKLADVPDAGLPPATAHANVYGVVPPETTELNVNIWLTVPEVGPVTDAVRVVELMETSWNAVVLAPL